MAESEHITQTLKVMMRQIEEEERATNEKKRAANSLSRLLNEQPVFPDIDAAASARMTLPDEYYGRQMPDVIRAIMEKRKRGGFGAATVNEIHAAMKQGGYHFQAQNDVYAKRGIYGILANTEDFHKLPDGRYGLTAWYPAAKTRVDVEDQPPKPKPKGKGKRKTKKQAQDQKPKEASKPAGNAEHDDQQAGPTPSVIEYVQSHPRCTPSQVVAAIVPNVRTQAKNPAELLHATIRKLVQIGKISRVGDGLEVPGK